jgi:hypothetical protein
MSIKNIDEIIFETAEKHRKGLDAEDAALRPLLRVWAQVFRKGGSSEETKI